MFLGIAIVLAISAGAAAPPATLHGRVTDAQTGDPIAQATVLIDGAPSGDTDGDGEFLITIADPHRVTLLLAAAGYDPATRSLAIAPGANEAGSIALNRESAGVNESVTVIGIAGGGSASARTLTRSDLQALRMVLMDDPLRSVHALPGVVANRDLRSEFTLRGAGFDQVGVYMDGVLTGGFFHTLSDSDATDRATLSIVNQDTIGSARLLPGVTDAAFGNQTAGVLDLQTRDGSRERTTARVSTGFVASTGVVEGPIAGGSGSWMLAGRTTRFNYLHQVVATLTHTGAGPNDDSDLELSDMHGKAVFDVAPHHQVGVSILAGVLGTDEGSRLRFVPQGNARNLVNTRRSSSWLGSVTWKYAPGARAFAEVRAFAIGSADREHNQSAVPLTDNGRTGTGVRADGSWQATVHHVMQVGAYFQLAREHGRSQYFPWSATTPRVLGSFNARRFEASGYAQDTWAPSARVSVTGGIRFERDGSPGGPRSPRIRLTWSASPSWTLRAAAGVQRQSPPIATLFGLLGNPRLRAPMSAEIDAGFEHALSDRLSIAVDAYRRRDHHQLFSLSEPRLSTTGATVYDDFHQFENSIEGSSRGVDVAIRRSGASRLSGWFSYAYGHANAVDARDGLVFPTDADQRHTLNAFGSFQVTSTLALSALWRYGSGTPQTGFIDPSDGIGFVSARNRARLAPYCRLDVRANKVFALGRRTLTASAEVLNVLNDRNEYNVETTILSGIARGQYGAGPRRSPGAVVAIGFTVQ